MVSTSSSLVAQKLKRLLVMWETQVQSLASLAPSSQLQLGSYVSHLVLPCPSQSEGRRRRLSRGDPGKESPLPKPLPQDDQEHPSGKTG